ncbi:MAG: metallothionein [Ectothiorhodospiraceae bacterium]|nr:metallothionein [Ectothiorhodospiraceae bacterium]MCH8502958.1 metallothionein [Ectothiorhodospiraceae bacterium]
MTDANKVKCACADCKCMVTPDKAIKRAGKPYCGEPCANGHASGSGCGHTGCDCHG